MLPIPTDRNGCFVHPEEPREYLHTCLERERDHEADQWVCARDGHPCGAHPEPPRMANECPRFQPSPVAPLCPQCLMDSESVRLWPDNEPTRLDGYYACPQCDWQGTGQEQAKAEIRTLADLLDVAQFRLNNTSPEGPGEAA